MQTYTFDYFTIQKNKKGSYDFVTEASTLLMNAMPLSFNIRSTITGEVREFTFESVELDGGEDVVSWNYYNTKDPNMKAYIYND